MSSLNLQILYNKNDGLIMSPSELIENYLFGIPLNSGDDGRRLSSQAIRNHILSAQKKVENLFSIKLNKQVVLESRDFNRQEFTTWGYIRTMFPVSYVDRLDGYVNDVMQVEFPKQWISIKKSTDIAVFRNVQLIPNTGKGAVMNQNSVVFNGIAPAIGWFGQSYIPNYWRIRYITGWDEVPQDLFDFIAKFAAINILNIVGDILYGVGVTSVNISLDGVSQTTPLARSSNNGIFGGRIKQYLSEMNTDLPILKSQYRGFVFEVL